MQCVCMALCKVTSLCKVKVPEQKKGPGQLVPHVEQKKIHLVEWWVNIQVISIKNCGRIATLHSIAMQKNNT